MTVKYRIEKLKTLYNIILEESENIAAAIKADFNKNSFDVFATETGLVLEEIRHNVKHLKRWTKAKKKGISLKNFPSTGRIYSEPYGRVLIVSPWNYPFQLGMLPLVGAIAAGNQVTIKPSIKTRNTYEIIKKIIGKVFSTEEVEVTDSREVLNRKFDFIFFTGGAETGKEIMRKAADNLTPICLELGGKSPVIVDEDANVELAARRLAWAKFLNAGQTCVAPDYILVHEKIKTRFIESFIENIKKQYYITDGKLSAEFTHLISENKADEIRKLIANEKVLFGGQINGRIMEPTVIELGKLTSLTKLKNITETENITEAENIIQSQNITEAENSIKTQNSFAPKNTVETKKDIKAAETTQMFPHSKEDYCFTYANNPIMQTEIFAPLAPIISFDNLIAAANYIKSGEKPLALYYFGKNTKIIKDISFGGGCINDAVMHVAEHSLPFGGVGNSGMGNYHGKASFDIFSHSKSILIKGNMDIKTRYAPHKEKDLAFLKKIMK